MVRNYIKKGGRGSLEFILTINNVTWPKSLTGEWFKHDPLFVEIAVGEEDYNPPLDCDTGMPSDAVIGKHHHCFFKTSEPVKLDYVREMVITLTDDGGFDLQCCKSRKSWLIYLSKGDKCPYLYNILVKDLSLFARANYHLVTKYREPGVIDRADHFMIGAGNFRNVILDLAENHMERLREKKHDARVTLEPNMSCWLTRSIFHSLVNREHVYIFGLPGLGKTELVDRFIQRFKTFRVGATDRFMFGGLNESHKVILFEDFKPFEHEKMLPTVLSIMDKKPVSISAKYATDCTKMFDAQVIFVSNEPIPSCMSMLERRVKFFCVDHKLYDCVTCLFFEIN
jgi:hypothetical protein